MLVFYQVFLRFVHVIASVCWAGGGFIFFWFVEPTAKSLEPAGMKFVQHMTGKRRFNIFMVVNSTLTVLSGGLLIWNSSGGDLLAYMKTGPGLGFALGSAVGIAVYFVGMLGISPRAGKLAKIGQEIELAGGPPSPEQVAVMQKLDKEMTMYSTIDFWMVALSLALMATARYWLF
jgi:uncharacterized membrane protein